MKSIALFALAIAWLPASAVTLFDGPARVTATARAAGAGLSAIDVVIHQPTHEFRLTVHQKGRPEAALAALKARSGWKQDVLFIRDDCLDRPPKSARDWRCAIDQVFGFVDSRAGRRLVHLGEVHAGDECAEEARAACALDGDTFSDVHDGLEINALLPRGESPAILLELYLQSGELIVDLDGTWARNQERFTAGERCLAATAEDRAEHCIDGIHPRRAYLFNTALATYTRRAEVLARTQAQAREALCIGVAEAACSENLRLSALMLSSIRPGEKPRPRGSVTTVALPPEAAAKK